MEYLLSVVIATKNRYCYLFDVLDAINEMDLENVEIVVQDNTLDNSEMLKRLPNYKYVNYYHSTDVLSQSGNSNLAVKNAKGKYVCYIGDDDIITKDIVGVTEFLSENNIDACTFPCSIYYWNDVVFKSIKYSQFKIDKENKTYYMNPKKELYKVLKHGSTSMRKLPKVYHGIVSKNALDKVYEQCGTYFPGESPDMANAVSLALVIDKYVRIPIIPIVDGFGGKSAGGLGVAGKHKRKISEVAQLSNKAEENWDSRIPKIWIGSTVWCDSCIKALNAMEHPELINKLNFAKLYARILVFDPDCKKYVKEIKKSFFTNIKILYYRLFIFAFRALNYLKNLLINKVIKKDRVQGISIEEAVKRTEDYNKELLKK